MKKLFIAALAGLLLSACSNKKAEKQAIVDEVMKIHEKVMSADGQLEANKMKLDTLIRLNKLAAHDTAVILNKQLGTAEDAMENWMHKFDYDQKGKSEDETIAYMKDQKKQIIAIDSSMNAGISASNQYLKKIKK
jgi:PBP1b-binding outer membrane lipoprotein LpoB